MAQIVTRKEPNCKGKFQAALSKTDTPGSARKIIFIYFLDGAAFSAASFLARNLLRCWPMTNPEQARLVALLDAAHKWPAMYAFKFIVPAAKGKELQALIPESQTMETRPSAGGKYLAYTFHCPMGSAMEVLEIYARVKGIPGLVSL